MAQLDCTALVMIPIPQERAYAACQGVWAQRAGSDKLTDMGCVQTPLKREENSRALVRLAEAQALNIQSHKKHTGLKSSCTWADIEFNQTNADDTLTM